MSKTRKIIFISLIASLYAALTLSIPGLSYGPLQFRVSEVLVLLAFFDPLYIPALTLGCALANLASPFGLVDVIVGSFASYLSLLMINKSKNIYIASLWPAFFSFIIGLEIYFLSSEPINFMLVTLQIAISEFVVVSILGVGIFKIIESRKDIISLIKLSPK